MVKAVSSRGGMVRVEVKGVAEAIRFLRARGKDINQGADAGTFQAANMIQQEVQESILGLRSEPKSVDTGLLGNSITVDKIKESAYRVFSTPKTYPGTRTTTADVAKLLEFGTSSVQARSHFRNTLARNKSKAGDIIRKAIKLV